MEQGLRSPVVLPVYALLVVLLDYVFDTDINLYTLVPPLLALLVRALLRPRTDPVPLALAASTIAAIVELDGADLAAYSVLIIAYAVLPHLETGWRLAVYKARQLLVVALVVASPIPLAAYYSHLAVTTGYPTYAVMLAATTAVYLLVLQALSPDPARPAILGERLAVNPHDLAPLLRHFAKLVLGVAAAMTLNENPLSLPVLLLIPVVHLLLHSNARLETPTVAALATVLLVAEVAM